MGFCVHVGCTEQDFGVEIPQGPSLAVHEPAAGSSAEAPCARRCSFWVFLSHRLLLLLLFSPVKCQVTFRWPLAVRAPWDGSCQGTRGWLEQCKAGLCWQEHHQHAGGKAAGEVNADSVALASTWLRGSLLRGWQRTRAVTPSARRPASHHSSEWQLGSGASIRPEELCCLFHDS